MYMSSLKHILKKLICVFLVSALLCPVFSVRSYALENCADDCHVASEGACLMDADSGVVLFEKNASSAYYPASITKVLTALVVLENCDNLSEQVVFSYDAVHIEEDNSTIIGASEGDRLSVLDCLYCLLFQSANEVANALAEHVGAKHPELKEEGMNDRDVFVKMMNAKADELGCRGSHFNNPSGLTDENHYTTAYDMCLIMAAAIGNSTFLDIESHTYWTHAPIKRYPDADDPWNTVYAKHSMLKRSSSQYYSGTIAGKTGYTVTAGNTLVTACTRDSMTLVTCVLNAHANQYNDTRRLMDFGFDNFKSLEVTDYDNTNSALTSDYQIAGVTMLDSVTLGIDNDTRITIPKGGNFVEVKKRLEIGEDQSEGFGKLIYTYGDHIVGTAELKLMNIGESEELVEAAKNDALLSEVLGLETETAPEASKTAEDSGKTAEDPGKTAEDSEKTAGDITASLMTEDGTDMMSKETGEADMMSKQTGEADIMSKAAAIAKKAILPAAAVIAAALIAAVIIGTVRERRQHRRRAERRAGRLRRTGDMSGSMQIDMDLEVQRRLRKRKKGRK